jgi:uncharacterized protein YqeY
MMNKKSLTLSIRLDMALIADIEAYGESQKLNSTEEAVVKALAEFVRQRKERHHEHEAA